MKRIIGLMFILALCLSLLTSCSGAKQEAPQPEEPAVTEPAESEQATEEPEAPAEEPVQAPAVETVTEDMAFEGVNNYCHANYDWEAAKDNPDLMSVEMGEGSDAEYQMVFRSYTGAIVNFYVDKATGFTRIMETNPELEVEEEAGSFNLFDYLGDAVPEHTEEAAPAQTEASEYGGDKFVGIWSDEISQRAELTVVPTDQMGVYIVMIHWGSSYNEFSEWDFTASYDEAGDSLTYTDGAYYTVTLSEESEDGPEERKTEWEGSEGRFYLENDQLRWEDSKEENNDEDVRFNKVDTFAPDGETLTQSFFKPIAALPIDDAGSAMKQAQAAYETLKFADDNVIWSNNPAELGANLAEAWQGLSSEEQEAFEQNLFAVQGLITNAAVNWGDFGYLFEDAGVGESMQILLADQTAMEGFNRLFDTTVETCF